MNAEVAKYVLPSEEELGAVTALAAPAERGWALPPEEPTDDDLPEGVGPDSTHAYIWRHAREAAAVLRSLMHRDETGDGPLAGMSSGQIVAAFLVTAGQAVGVRVLRQLQREEQAEAGKAVAQLKEVAHNAGMHALETVRARIESGDYLELGGEDYAKALLGEVVAPWWAEGVVEEANFDYSAGSAFKMLAQLDPTHIAPHVSHEHPQTIALILSQLRPERAAAILSQFPERVQADVAHRVATMEDVPQAVFERVEQALYRMFSSMAKGVLGVGGPKVVADIVNCTGASIEKNILDQMDAQAPEIAEQVRNLMFTFEDVRRLTDKDFQAVLKQVDQKDLVVALKAASAEFKDKLMGNCSEKVRAFLTEEVGFLGPMPLKDVEETQLRIVQQARQLEEKGEITIIRGPDEPMV